MGSKNPLKGKTIYFSHPSFTFRTDTERYCISIFKNLKVEGTINPSNYGLKDDISSLIKEADAIVGMSVARKLTYLVWNEMKYGEENGLDIYTIMVESKHDIGPLVKGIPDSVEKLPLEDSKSFTSEILRDEHRESVYSMLIGNWGKRF